MTTQVRTQPLHETKSPIRFSTRNWTWDSTYVCPDGRHLMVPEIFCWAIGCKVTARIPGPRFFIPTLPGSQTGWKWKADKIRKRVLHRQPSPDGWVVYGDSRPLLMDFCSRACLRRYLNLQELYPR